MLCDHPQNRPAELVARFIDAKLRSGNKGTSEEELEDVLDQTMTLFRYIDGKVGRTKHSQPNRRPSAPFSCGPDLGF